jgi:hypothetical protein
MSLASFGAPRSAAAIAMLGLRAEATGATILVSSLLLVLLRRQFTRREAVP